MNNIDTPFMRYTPPHDKVANLGGDNCMPTSTYGENFVPPVPKPQMDHEGNLIYKDFFMTPYGLVFEADLCDDDEPDSRYTQYDWEKDHEDDVVGPEVLEYAHQVFNSGGATGCYRAVMPTKFWKKFGDREYIPVRDFVTELRAAGVDELDKCYINLYEPDKFLHIVMDDNEYVPLEDLEEYMDGYNIGFSLVVSVGTVGDLIPTCDVVDAVADPDPNDNMLVLTHPDLTEKVEGMLPRHSVTTKPLHISSKEFIDIGLRVMQLDLGSYGAMKELRREIVKLFETIYEYARDAEIIYMVSGGMFHRYLAKIFEQTNTRVIEVCPVPRVNNGVCPEMYIDHYVNYFQDPSFGHTFSQLLDEQLAYIIERNYSFDRLNFTPIGQVWVEKIHSIMPYIAEKFNVVSPNVGFKPRAVFRLKPVADRSTHSDQLKVYLSFGSNTQVNPTHLKWLQTMFPPDCKLDVDARWLSLMQEYGFSACTPIPFVDHTKELFKYDLVIHHGGAGIVQTCLVVGVPQVILPQIGDQFVWDNYLDKWGVTRKIEHIKDRADLLTIIKNAPPPLPNKEDSLLPTLKSIRNQFHVRHFLQCPDLDRRVLEELYYRIEPDPAKLDVKSLEAYFLYTSSTPHWWKYKHSKRELLREIHRIEAKFKDNTYSLIGQIVRAGLEQAMLSSRWEVISKPNFFRHIAFRHGFSNYQSYYYLVANYLTRVEAACSYFGLAPPPKSNSAPTFAELDTRIFRQSYHHVPCNITTMADLEAVMRRLAVAYNPKTHAYILFFGLRGGRLPDSLQLYHSCMYYQGRYVSLQKDSLNKVFIRDTAIPPVVGTDYPLVKLVQFETDGRGLSTRVAKDLLDGTSYKAIGDNCLFLSNWLALQLTGRIVPWCHFGLFGIDVTMQEHKLGSIISRDMFRKPRKTIWLDRTEHTIKMKGYRWSYAHLYLPKIPKSFDLHGEVHGELEVKENTVAFMRVLQFINSEACLYELDWESSSLPVDKALLLMKRFRLTPKAIDAGIRELGHRNIKLQRWERRVLTRLASTLSNLGSTPLIHSICDLGVAAASVPRANAMRKTRKVVWAPLLRLSVPRHYIVTRYQLKQRYHVQSEPMLANVHYKVITDVREIYQRYQQLYAKDLPPDIKIDDMGQGEYLMSVKVPVRKIDYQLDPLTEALISELREKFPHDVGVFSMRYASPKLEEAVTDRYFVGAPQGFLSDVEKDELAQAVYNCLRPQFEDAKLMDINHILKEWDLNYSIGFPFRLEESRLNQTRRKFIHSIGGREVFRQKVMEYINSPEKFKTISHVFIKDEVLKKQKVEDQGKIRTIIGQDHLTYFCQMMLDGDVNKRLAPLESNLVQGISPSHGEMAKLMEEHSKYKYHGATDITALDSTMARDFMDVQKRLRKLSYQNHPQRDQIYRLYDVVYDNLFESYLWSMYSGRIRLKHQGTTTGNASTTPLNSVYTTLLFLKAWKGLTDRPYEDFFRYNKLSNYGDDNVISSNCFDNTWNVQAICDYFKRFGVELRVEAEGSDISDVSFLAKQFSRESKLLEEIKIHTGYDVPVAVIHDRNRLLMKFDDIKKRPSLKYLYERAIGLQLNCAHHPDVYEVVDKYLNKLEAVLRRRAYGQKVIQRCKRFTYAEVLKNQYAPVKPEQAFFQTVNDKQGQLWDKLLTEFDKLRIQLLSVDYSLGNMTKVMRSLTNLVSVTAGFDPELEELFIKDDRIPVIDTDFTIERFLWLKSGLVEEYGMLVNYARQSPFSAFLNLEKFWEVRYRYTYDEDAQDELQTKMLVLLGLYVLVSTVEKWLHRCPVFGTLLKLLTLYNRFQNTMYANLNALYWSLFGESSLVISSFVPKDNFMHLKFLTLKIFSTFVKLDTPALSADWDQLKQVFDSMAVVVQHVHQIVNHLDFSSLIPEPEFQEDPKPEQHPLSAGLLPWVPLDHSVEAKRVFELYTNNQTAMVTGPTGAGKSTDFVVHLKEHFDTVYLCLPRRILVMNSPLRDAPRLFAGTQDRVREHAINICTNGYLSVLAPKLGPRDVILLDEFHEMDENAMWLLHRYGHKCVLLTATPNFPRSDQFSHVPLTQGRNQDWTVREHVRPKPRDLNNAMVQTINEAFGSGARRVLVIHPSYRWCKEFGANVTKLWPGKRMTILYKNNREVGDYHIYLATSVVDAGLTIPDLDFVIDSGLSIGYKGHKFGTWNSSRNTAVQRKGRTGRTCDGTYIRLNHKYDELLFDTSRAFQVNYPDVIEYFTGKKSWPEKVECYHHSIPYHYNPIFHHKDGWSIAAYLMFYFQSQDIAEANTLYTELLNGNRMHTMINTIRETFPGCHWLPLSKVHTFLNEWTIDGEHNDIDVNNKCLCKTTFM